MKILNQIKWVIYFIPLMLNAQSLETYRDFWYPTYHVQALNYCTFDGKYCGRAVANRYCQMMGYDKAVKATENHNVGVTYFIDISAECRGWTCNGFKLITCEKQINRRPLANYYQRSRRFVYPRYNHYRIDWCYENGKQCGRHTAYSFCRRMGYSKTISYHKQKIMATKALGNQKLCFGSDCIGFSEISCYR